MTQWQAFKIDLDGSIVVDSDQYGNQRFRIIEGSEYVAQSTRFVLQTERGEDPWHRDNGLPIEEVVGLFNSLFTKGVVTRTLLSNPDIQSVESVNVSQRNDSGRSRAVDVEITVTGENDIVTSTLQEVN